MTYSHGTLRRYKHGCRCTPCRAANAQHAREARRDARNQQPIDPIADLERRTVGDALQLAGLVRDHGPDTLHRLLDTWGEDHIRRVCIALAAAVDLDSTPQELWGWLGPVDNRTAVTTRESRLWQDGDPHRLTAREIHDARPADPQRREARREVRSRRATQTRRQTGAGEARSADGTTERSAA